MHLYYLLAPCQAQCKTLGNAVITKMQENEAWSSRSRCSEMRLAKEQTVPSRQSYQGCQILGTNPTQEWRA